MRGQKIFEKIMVKIYKSDETIKPRSKAFKESQVENYIKVKCYT